MLAARCACRCAQLQAQCEFGLLQHGQPNNAAKHLYPDRHRDLFGASNRDTLGLVLIRKDLRMRSRWKKVFNGARAFRQGKVGGQDRVR